MLIELDPKNETSGYYKIDDENEVTCRIVIATDSQTRIQELAILSLQIPTLVKMTKSHKCSTYR
jgi:hypothetical protein